MAKNGKSPFDESLFNFYATSQLVKNTGGIETKIAKSAIYTSISLSPDKKYMLDYVLTKPFSYLVTAGGFPSIFPVVGL